MIRNPRDFYTGLLFAVFGVATLVIAQSYAIGTASRMGPGYFPRLLGFLLLGLGLLQSVFGLRTPSAGPLEWHWRPLFILLLSVVLFSLVTPWLGLVAGGSALVFVSSMGSQEFRWREALIVSLLQGAAAAALFAYGLGVPLPVWPEFLGGGGGMELLDNLALGFSVAATPMNLLYAFIGCVVGTLIGVLPGIGPVATIAMLLPLTYGLAPVTALIMLAGIYYGASYGGSTTAILVNLPGEMSSVITVLDGHQMAKQGRAGPALCIAALGSFFAGTAATMVIAAFAPPLADLALKFDAAEYFSLMVLGLVSAVALAHGSVLKAVLMTILGLTLGMVGTDVNSGVARFSFNRPELIDGIGFVAMTMGLFAFAEIAINLERAQFPRIVADRIGSLWISMKEFRQSFPAVLRGSALGSVLGILPGGGATLSAFASYTLEKKIAKDPSRFGRGAIEGVAGPEAANNAGAQISFVPMLTLGIPSNAVMALMVGALIIHDIQPGPEIMTKTPGLFWGLIASMWIGNAMLVILNLPLVGLWVKLLSVPYRMLYPMILLCCAVGAFSTNNNMFDVWVAIVFGFLGYLFLKLGCEPAPLLLGYILGPLLEENLRRALVLSRGDYTVFATRPISAAMLLMAAGLLILTIVPAIRAKREAVFQES